MSPEIQALIQIQYQQMDYQREMMVLLCQNMLRLTEAIQKNTEAMDGPVGTPPEEWLEEMEQHPPSLTHPSRE